MCGCVAFGHDCHMLFCSEGTLLNARCSFFSVHSIAFDFADVWWIGVVSLVIISNLSIRVQLSQSILPILVCFDYD